MARHNTASALRNRLRVIATLRDEKRVIESSISDNQSHAIDLFDGFGQASLTFLDDSGDGFKGTVVAGTSLSLNSLKLKKRIGAKRFNKLTTSALDMNKLEAAIASGDIDPKDVSECSTEVDKKPYIRITKTKT